MRSAVKDELSAFFRPEFLSRLDELVVFEALRPAEVRSATLLKTHETSRNTRKHS